MVCVFVILLMKEILHQLTGGLSHYLRGFIHPRWLLGISDPSTVWVSFDWDFQAGKL